VAPIDAPAQRVVRAEPTDLGRSTPRQADRTGREASEEGIMYGEVVLDGVALGRWINRHLERQINRPPSGVTGFDSRMSPTWPGAPVDAR
jgi:hypothetical protein